MQIIPQIVFKTPFYEPTYRQFRNPSELQKFLAVFDFMRPHKFSHMQTGLPEFQLGTKLEFTIDGYFCESNVKWGPRFIVAQSVYLNGKSIFARLPMDVPTDPGKGAVVMRELDMVRLHPGMMDAILDMNDIRNFRQLWPICEESRSEFIKFLTMLNRQKYQIRRR